MTSCPHCTTRMDVTPEHVEACGVLEARWNRVKALADEYTPYIPWAPLTGAQTCNMFSHLRSYPRSLTDEQAEAAVRLALQLGWRPLPPKPEEEPSEPAAGPTPEPALVGAVQPSLPGLGGGA